MGVGVAVGSSSGGEFWMESSAVGVGVGVAVLAGVAVLVAVFVGVADGLGVYVDVDVGAGVFVGCAGMISKFAEAVATTVLSDSFSFTFNMYNPTGQLGEVGFWP